MFKINKEKDKPKVIKKKNEQNRKRNKLLNFRVTPDEWNLLMKKVEISGLLKQEYILNCLLHHQVKVKADYRLKDHVSMEILRLAQVIKKFGRLEDTDQKILSYILEIYEDIKQEKIPQ